MFPTLEEAQMSPLFWILMLDLVTFVPAALFALGLSFTPWVRSRVHIPTATPDLLRSRPDTLASLALGIAAILAALVAFAPFIEGMLPDFFTLNSDPFAFRWHDFSRELIVGSLALIVAALILKLFRSTPRAPVPPSGPRGLRSYAPGRALATLAAALTALLVLTVFAGSISSADEDGRHTLFVIETGGQFSAASGRFYGWAYGVPAAIAAVALVAATMFALHANATRTFLDPQSVGWETQARRALATRILWFSTGILVFVLGDCALRMGGAAGAQLNAPDYSWGTSMAAFEPLLTWGGRILRGVGLTLLMLVGLTHRTGRGHR